MAQKKIGKLSLVKYDDKQRAKIVDEALQAKESVPVIAKRNKIRSTELYRLIKVYLAEHPDDTREYLQMRKKKKPKAKTSRSMAVVRVSNGSQVNKTNGSNGMVVHADPHNNASAELHGLTNQNGQLKDLLREALYERDALTVSLRIVIREEQRHNRIMSGGAASILEGL
jgi:predicted ATPase